jgi:hypothetical protein
MHHTNEDHTANAKRSCVTFATRGIPDRESSAGGAVVLDASGSICCDRDRDRVAKTDFSCHTQSMSVPVNTT